MVKLPKPRPTFNPSHPIEKYAAYKNLLQFY